MPSTSDPGHGSAPAQELEQQRDPEPVPPPAGESFVERVLEVVDAIPPGRVMTYGDVAATLGSRAARMVGQIMAYYGGDVPWWRVVRASGLPAQNHEHIALQHYRAEGTPLRGGAGVAYRVDLRAARHHPQRDHPEGR